MGALDRFEKGIERAVNSAFAKAFRSEVQPVEVASALRRECDNRAAVLGRNRSLVPNRFVVELGQSDYERIGEWQDALGDELRVVVTDHARQQRYGFVGPVSISFEEAEDLDTGVFRVRSAMAKAAAPPGGPPAAPAAVAPAAQVAPPDAAAPTQVHRPEPPAVPTTMPSTPPSLDIDGRQYRLVAPVTVLGRDPEVDIPLDDPGASRRHAEVRVSGGRARIVDLGSTNGTFVDGERVGDGALADGSTITMGRTRITFRAGHG